MKFAVIVFAALVVFLGSSQSGSAHKFCPIYWQHFDGLCYRYFGDKVTFETAQSSCHTYYTNSGRAELASVHNNDVNSFLYDLFRSSAGDLPDGGPPYSGAWIGLKWDNSVWMWIDGSPRDYDSWVPGQPNSAGVGNCGHFWRWDDSYDQIKGWADTGCTITLPYICQMKPNIVEL